MTDQETKDELTETYNRIEPELSLINHPIRYVGWAESELDKFAEIAFDTIPPEEDDPLWDWYRQMEDALLNIKTTLPDVISHFCGYGMGGESQGSLGDEVRYVRQPHLKDRKDRKELFKEMMEFTGYHYLYERDGTIAFYHPDPRRFRHQDESKFDIPEWAEEYNA